eukprot:Clim_evm82s77 gene=Clim_evmTU82s77
MPKIEIALIYRVLSFLFLPFAITVNAAQGDSACASVQTHLEDIVYKVPDQSLLCINGREFIFASFNAPSMTLIEDPMTLVDLQTEQISKRGQLRAPTHFEVDDLMESLQQMGGQVVRIYPPSLQGSSKTKTNSSSYFYLEQGSSTYLPNEAMFESLDYVLESANLHNIKVIFPFIDHNNFFGGVNTFCSTNSVECTDKFQTPFFQEPLKSAFISQIVEPIVNRYKGNPAILAWETGNELNKCYWDTWPCTPSTDPDIFDQWTQDISTIIRQRDPDHLIMDGSMAVRAENYLENNPNVDIVSFHEYPGDDTNASDMQRRMDGQSAPGFATHKAVLYGEMGLCPFDYCIQPALEYFYNNSQLPNHISGVLLWSLRPHQDTTDPGFPSAGFNVHQEWEGLITSAGTYYWSYHWPGFKVGDNYQESLVINEVQRVSDGVQGIEVVNYPRLSKAPEAPSITNCRVTEGSSGQQVSLVWRGSAGATSYIIEKRTIGDWQVLARDVVEIVAIFSGTVNEEYGYQPYIDSNPESGNSYRVTAVNAVGQSQPSEPVTVDLSASLSSR